jgi:AraC family transcriptional regulator, regulatory protein of adaptative response / DNA-3-methyladenine glycosylase II
MMDDEQRYQASASKDARFDGVFFVAVTSTGVYCRPSCPAITPKRANVRFYSTAAAAQEAGFRACKRCRPDASPGSPEWNVRADVTARAMRLIGDGIVDRAGVAGLASQLGYEQRHVRRLLTTELGAGPLALARAQRAQTARILVETTNLAMGDIAFAAGFASIRQFNATMLEVFDTRPTLLRERAAKRNTPAPPGVIRLRLAYRPPIDLERMFGFLAARAIPGVEEVTSRTYRRTITLPNGAGILSLRLFSESSAANPPGKDLPPPPGRDLGAREDPGFVECDLELDDLRDVTAAVTRCRRLLDLDADPVAVSDYLSRDDALGPLARACPGRRSPGHVDGDELALRAVLGQQVSVAAARRLGQRLAAGYGKPLSAPSGSLTHLFPDAATIAAADPGTLPMPGARAAALVGLAAALASGTIRLHPGADREEETARLLALPGVGPWTASYIRMRALADPDAFLPTDVGVRTALRRLGASWAGGVGAAETAERWHPWRSYAMHHLWATLEQPISRGTTS